MVLAAGTQLLTATGARVLNADGSRKLSNGTTDDKCTCCGGCYRQARKCSDGLITGAWMTCADATAIGSLSWRAGAICVYFDFTDPTYGTSGSGFSDILYTAAGVTTYADCAACLSVCTCPCGDQTGTTVVVSGTKGAPLVGDPYGSEPCKLDGVYDWVSYHCVQTTVGGVLVSGCIWQWHLHPFGPFLGTIAITWDSASGVYTATIYYMEVSIRAVYQSVPVTVTCVGGVMSFSLSLPGVADCVGYGTSYVDQNGHGTHVAGTIAALDNGVGVVGVAPGAKLWAVRVLDRNGSGSWSSVICGIDFVTSKAPGKGGPIKVANMSLGGFGTSDNNCGLTNNDPLHKAICRARDAGVTIVVAAGNSNTNASSFVPAAYHDSVITVSALADSDGKAGGLGKNTSYGPDDTFANFSNYGNSVDIGAPGVSIYSTWPNNQYATLSGTSMATPHATGAVALYIFNHPSALWNEVRSALQSAGEALGNGHTDPTGLHSENVLNVASL